MTQQTTQAQQQPQVSVEVAPTTPLNYADRFFSHVESGSTVVLVVVGAVLWMFRSSLSKAVDSYVEANHAFRDALIELKSWRQCDDSFRDDTKSALSDIKHGIDRIESKIDPK